MMDDSEKRRRRNWTIAGFVIVDVVVLAVLIALGVIKAQKTAVIDVMLVPGDATVEINGSQFQTGVYKTFPGEVMATVAADGFEAKTLTLNLDAENTTRIYEYLMPSADNLNYYAKNELDATNLAKIAGEDARAMLKIIAIKDVLPIVDFKYGGLNGTSRELVIDQDEECDAYFCLVVTSNTGEIDKGVAQDLIKAKGYNSEDYEIRYAGR